MTKYLKKYSLLYVEDEELTREMVILYLKKYFLDIFVAPDGDSGYQLYLEKKPDMVITDIELPTMSGLELAKKVREEDEKIPILIMSAYTDTNYLLKAVELNLVKYLVKPINEKELKEALKLSFEKIEKPKLSKIELGREYSYDLFNYTLIYKDKIIPITSSQNKLLKLLLKNSNRVVTYSEIENYIWDYKGMSEAALRSLVHDIRKIIHKDIIKNISKIGYKINLS